MSYNQDNVSSVNSSHSQLVTCDELVMWRVDWQPSQPPHIGCLPYFYTWCGLSANLECRSEMRCTWLAENTGSKKSPKIGDLGTITQLCRAVSLQLRHVSTIGK